MKSPITSDIFCSTFCIEDGRLEIQSETTLKMHMLANWCDFVTIIGGVLIFVAARWTPGGTALYSQKGLYTVAVFVVVWGIFDAVKRVFLLRSSRKYIVTIEELQGTMDGRNVGAVSALRACLGPVRVYRRPFVPVLAEHQCVYLRRGDVVDRILARGTECHLEDATKSLYALGIDTTITTKTMHAFIS